MFYFGFDFFLFFFFLSFFPLFPFFFYFFLTKSQKKFGSLTFGGSGTRKCLLDLLGGNDTTLMIASVACYVLDVNHGGKITFEK